MHRFIAWRIPTRPERLNAHRLFSTIRPDARITKRVVATVTNFNDLVAKIRERHEDASVSSYKDEAYLAEFEHRLYEGDKPKVANKTLIEFREAGFGLNVESELYEIWTQCVAMFHSKLAEQIPEAVKLIVGGMPDMANSTLLHSVAVLLEDEAPFRRRKKFPAEKIPNFKTEVVRQWVAANGVTKQQDLDAVDRLIGQDVDHRLALEPAESFAKLTDASIEKARELAAKSGRGEDHRFIFYVFRCLQRIAAYAVQGKVQWRSQWLRGTKTNARAIAGTSKFQAELGALLKAQVLEVESSHSGSKGTAATYRLRFEIPVGGVDHHQVAKELGLELDPKNVPKK